MSAWKDGPEGDGYYWLRINEKDVRPEAIHLDRGQVFQIGCDKNFAQPLAFYNGFQWQKVKPYEQ